MYRYIIFIVFVVLLNACSSEVGSKYRPKSPAFGKMNDIVVICDKNVWESFIGDTFSYYYESAFPVMTQPEAIFDLRHMTSEEVMADDLKKQLRTFIVLANLGDANSPTSKWVGEDLGADKKGKAMADTSFFSSVGTDKWAKGQLIVYLFGKDLNALTQSIVKTFPAVAKRIQEHDKAQLEANVYSHKNNNEGAQQQLIRDYGLDIKIPADYVKSPLKSDFTWYRKDFNGMSQHLIFARKKYTSPSDLSKAALLAWRDELTKSIEGSVKGSFMKTNAVDLPVYEYAYQLNSTYTKELRGIWEMENDFMGGPFFNYTLLNAATNEIIMIDAFVFAPGKEKRDYMQQLDHIVKTARLVASKPTGK